MTCFSLLETKVLFAHHTQVCWIWDFKLKMQISGLFFPFMSCFGKSKQLLSDLQVVQHRWCPARDAMFCQIDLSKYRPLNMDVLNQLVLWSVGIWPCMGNVAWMVASLTVLEQSINFTLIWAIFAVQNGDMPICSLRSTSNCDTVYLKFRVAEHTLL